ncbi:hypothetical protein ABE26_15980 [Cytobacillus firmus]|nr:hypothetical protein [Cytobacillus firmus]
MDVAGGRAYFENWADVSWGCSLFGLTTIFLVARSFSALFLWINSHFPGGSLIFGFIPSN